MSASTRSDRVEVFQFSAESVKGRGGDTYTRAPGTLDDHAYWARKSAANAREMPSGMQQNHLVDWVFYFSRDEAGDVLDSDGVLRHEGEVYAIAGIFPVRRTRELQVFAVSASDEIRTLVNG